MKKLLNKISELLSKVPFVVWMILIALAIVVTILISFIQK